MLRPRILPVAANAAMLLAFDEAIAARRCDAFATLLILRQAGIP